MSFGIIVKWEDGHQNYYENEGMTFGEWLETFVNMNIDHDSIISIEVDK